MAAGLRHSAGVRASGGSEQQMAPRPMMASYEYLDIAASKRSPVSHCCRRTPERSLTSCFDFCDLTYPGHSRCCAHIAHRRLAHEPSAGELMKLASTVSSSDPNLHSIKIHGQLRSGGCRLSFLALYRAPEHFALRVESGAEARPLFFVSERQIILYNPVENAVVYASPVRFQFSCRSRDNGVRFTLEAYNSAAPSELTVDIRSLFSCRAKREHVATAGRGAFRFTRVSENGNSLVALVDLAAQVSIQTDRLDPSARR